MREIDEWDNTGRAVHRDNVRQGEGDSDFDPDSDGGEGAPPPPDIGGDGN